MSDVDEFIRRSLQHKTEYKVVVRGHQFIVHPQVLSPKYSYQSTFILKNWDVENGMSVLDIGTGCGVLAISAALAGATRVTAVDRNTYACDVARKNAESNKVSGIVTVLQSNLFHSVRGRYDRIVCALPYWNRTPNPRIPLTYAVFDPKYRMARLLLTHAKRYLSRNGRLLVGFSTQGNVRLLEQVMISNGYRIERKVVETLGHTRILYKIAP